MKYNIEEALEVLSRTPQVIKALLSGVSDFWLRQNEGEGTWSPYEIVGHYIHGEKTDWITRTKILLSDSDKKIFEPFDREAQKLLDQTIPVEILINEFKKLRSANLEELRSLNISDEDLKLRGLHPALGEVCLSELLATWVVHDLGHISQISRVMAKQYKNEVGPWVEYLGVLGR